MKNVDELSFQITAAVQIFAFRPTDYACESSKFCNFAARKLTHNDLSRFF